MEPREPQVLGYRPFTDRPPLEARPAVRVVAGVIAVVIATSACVLVGAMIEERAWPFLLLAAGLLVVVVPAGKVAVTGRSFMTLKNSIVERRVRR